MSGRTGQGKRFGQAPKLGIGLLGHGFMGKAHTYAYQRIPVIQDSAKAVPYLRAICGTGRSDIRKVAKLYGYESYCTDWHALISDDRVQVLDNCAPNFLHEKPCIEAMKAGKHVVCEKPLGMTAQEAKGMWDVARSSSVKHMCGFNYRFVPAIRFARDLLKEGAIGSIHHFRAQYLQEWGMNPKLPKSWRMDKAKAGSGAIGDLGSHIIDLGRFLVGEPQAVSAATTTFISERPTSKGGIARVDVDDAFEATIRFDNGAIGALAASRFCAGRKNYLTLEINGSKGSLRFNLEELNVLELYQTSCSPPLTQGFRRILVTEAGHPYGSLWWPEGHVLGWEHAHVHELYYFLDAIVSGKEVAPFGATFEDGYRCAVVCDSIAESAREKRWVTIGT